MLELLNSNLDTIEVYYAPLHKYLIRDCIKIEDQIRSRKAAWLIAVKDYVRQKDFYNRDAEIYIEFRKYFTDKKGNTTFTNQWLKKKDRWPLQHKLRQKRLSNWKLFLVNEYQNIEACYI